MKYAIVKCINGNYFVHEEGLATRQSARISFLQLCAALWNAPDVVTGSVRIVDENLDTVEGYREFITHPAPEAAE